ncbi:cGMP-dependent 3',5'-cyclic phosphodiesterase-like [Clytia hemisphaerica]|uniref:Phosphodiesterase n=1 Tax=Clytia hemisphaerica TaxID=252671 RepID=A0A7M5UQP0_9CNID
MEKHSLLEGKQHNLQQQGHQTTTGATPGPCNQSHDHDEDKLLNKRRKSEERKLKAVLERLENDKNLVEFELSENLEELSTKLHSLLQQIYKTNLIQSYTFFQNPVLGDYSSFRNGKIDNEIKIMPSLMQKWCTNNNNEQNNKAHSPQQRNEITSLEFDDEFRTIFSLVPDTDFKGERRRSISSSVVSCCKARKSSNPKVISWPLSDDKSSENIGFVFLLLKPSSTTLLPALEKITVNLTKGYRRIMTEISNQQRLLLLSDLGSLFTKDIAELSRRIINKLTKTLNAESGMVLLINKNSDELYTEAFGDKLLGKEYRMELCNSGFLFLYSQSKVQSLLITKDSPIDKDLQKLKEVASVDINIEQLLVVPAYSEVGDDVIALFCLFNKIGAKTGFTKLDEELMQMVVKNCRHIVCNALDWKSQLIIQRQNESLLEISKTLFSHLDDVSILLHKIMEEARNLTNAERCSLFLVDHNRGELIAKVFDGIESENSSEIRIPITNGIAGYVATTGETLNIKDAYSHPLFYKEVDQKTGFKTRHILCFPIRSVSEQIIGVAQLCNKLNGNCFTKFDEERTLGFAIFVGLSLVQSLLYKKATDAKQRSKLANELMLYHMMVSQEEIDSYVKVAMPTKDSLHPDMDKFSFMPRISFAETDSIKVVLSMFNDLNVIKRWKVSESTLVRFILTVRRGYRDVPYHNWTHAWTVAHFSYTLLKKTNALDYLSDLEVFVLLVSCLCHDIDHRGTNNSFQISSQSVLASLYSSAGSVLERHHFAQAMCIVQTEHNNVFESLSSTDYKRALDLMQKMILATDLANHFKISKQLDELASTGIQKDEAAHRELLLSLFMTTSDLSDQTKPWESAVKVSDLLYQEFFSQGEMEKSLGYQPVKMMDKDLASIPDLQYSFLNNIAYPIYEKLSHFFPETNCILGNIKENQNQWSKIKEG